MGLRFVERMRATSAAERWVSHVKFPGVSLESANEASKLLVATFVRGWTDQTLSPFTEKEGFETFSEEFVKSLPTEAVGQPSLSATMRGLETAFRAGWSASQRREASKPSARRRLGLKA